MNNNQVLDLRERRELYKAMRSAHDGICPCCGDDTKKDNGFGYYCGFCNFKLTGNEVILIKSWHEDFHHNLPAILDKWRN